MNLKDDNCTYFSFFFDCVAVSEFKIGDRTFFARQGDKEALCQVFFCYKDANKGVIPGHFWVHVLRVGRPFTREIIITEKFSNEKSYASFDGAGHDIPKVEQLTGLKLHYIPPGAMIPKEAPSNVVSDPKKEKKIKKEKKEKHEKHEKHKKHKKSLK